MQYRTLSERPDWVSPPGDTLVEMLEQLEFTMEDFASEIGVTASVAHKIIEGRQSIDSSLARKISQRIGATQRFWLARESDYRASLGEVKEVKIDTLSALSAQLPLSDMRKYGWVDETFAKSNKDDDCLSFFGVSTLAQWQGQYENAFSQASYRKSKTFRSLEVPTIAWLRQGELVAAKDTVEVWSPEILRSSITDFKRLTWFKDPNLFLPKLKVSLAKAGVKLAIVRAPKGCSASGAVRILDDRTPLIQLSFRFLSDDQFWFSFFHEIGHLLLHFHLMPIVENDGVMEEEIEAEADRFAQEVIVPPRFYDEFLSLGGSRFPIIRFAKKLGIAPGLIVGQLQHAGIIKYSQMQHLKRRYRWTD